MTMSDRPMIASDCDCGTDLNDDHAADCATHINRCCPCCQTHVIPHVRCILR